MSYSNPFSTAPTKTAPVASPTAGYQNPFGTKTAPKTPLTVSSSGLKSGYGASNLTDTSGKSLLTYKNDRLMASQLLSDRVATSFDPTVPQKLTRDMLQNERLPVSASQKIKASLGGTYSEELDHQIALELSGSNQKSNLKLESLVPGTKNTATDPLENTLAKNVVAGKISQLDAQRQLAKAKGYTLAEDQIAPNSSSYKSPFTQTAGDLASHAYPSTMKTLADLQIDPASIKADPHKAITDAWNTIKGAVTSEAQNIKDLFTTKGSAQTGAALKTAAGAANIVFSPISALFAGANNIPVLGTVSRLASLPFAFMGDAGADTAKVVVNKLPISQQAKAQISPGLEEIFALAGQLALGKISAVGEAKVKELTAKFGPEDAKTIVNQAEKMAVEKPNTEAGFVKPSALIPKPVKEIAQEARGVASPQFASSEATRSADLIRNAKADIANASAVERLKYKDITKTFSKASDVENIGNISEYERTGKFKDAPTGYSDFYQKSIAASRAILQKTYGKDRVGYVENYVRRAFDFASKDDEAKGTAYLTNKTGSLSANKSNIKGRVLDMPLDEALADMRARGIKVKPVTTNPELLRQWSVENANQAIKYKEAWDSAKKGGLIEFVKQSGRVPEGKVPLDDRVAKVFFPTEKGMVQTGRYYADKTVAKVFNNAISKGFGGSPTFKGIRSINNAYNQFQLGFSAFHAVGTAINASISDLALGARQLLNRDIKGAAKSGGKGVVPGLSFISDLMKGRGFLADLVKDDPEALKTLQDKVNPAGARLRVEQQYTNASYENMVKAWKDAAAAFKQGNLIEGGNRTLAGAVRIPMAIVQKVASPLMEYAIPRVKMGAFLELADATLAKLPENATEKMKARALAESWDSIDNRFGQLVYDNLFWNKSTTDLAQVVTRSVGWNLGTIRELGGGLTDVVKKTIQGKGVSDRTLYAAMLPIYVGTLGAVYQYLHTGKKPSELKDYFYPKNGLTDKNGNDDRASLPTYIKDVYAYSNDPMGTVEHKASPLASLMFELATNRDYYGDMIRNPADPKSKQLQQVGGEALNQLLPFTVQNLQKITQEKGGTVRKVEPFLGVTKAPASIIQSSKQKAGNAAITQKRGAFAPRTPEQVDIQNQKNAARDAASHGDYSKLDAMIKMGIISPKSRAKFIKDSKLTPYQRSLESLPKKDRKQYIQ